jgi:hypothetical protein
MMLDELSYVIEPWISDCDVELIHRHAILTARFPLLSTRAPCTLEAPDSGLFGPVALDERAQAPLGGGVSSHPMAVDAQREGRVGVPELVHHAPRIDA